VEAQETPLAAHGGRVVWSSYDPVRKVFALKTFAGGAVESVPVAPRTVPFDADLGPDDSAGGRTVAVYSRCRREPRYVEGLPELLDPTAGSGCAVFRYDFGTGREQRLGRVSAPRGSETLPSIFGSRIAFARTARRGSLPRFKIRDARGTRNAGHGSLSGSTVNPSGADLSSTHLSFRWEQNGAECPSSDPEALGGEGAEIWLVNVRTTRRRRLARACSTSLQGLTVLRGPVAVGPRVLFKQQRIHREGEALVSVGPDGRRVRSEEDVSRVRNFARDPHGTYVGIYADDSRFRILLRPRATATGSARRTSG